AGEAPLLPGHPSDGQLSPDNPWIVAHEREGEASPVRGQSFRVVSLKSGPAVTLTGLAGLSPTAPPGAHTVLVAAYGEGLVRLAFPGKDLSKLPVLNHGVPISSLALSTGDRYLAAIGGDQLSLWNVGDGKLLGRKQLPELLVGVAFSNTGGEVVAAG